MFFTIGHSTHPVERFIAMLRAVGVGFVADVRTMPRSRTNPQFNTDVLRSRRRDVLSDVNAFCFHNYADYAMGDAFHAGLQHLREIGRERPCAIMCAEAVWWRCHRRIIADYLLAAGEDVRHIMADGKVTEARMTEGARRERGILVYPARATSPRSPRRAA